jgi:hypothetical protein
MWLAFIGLKDHPAASCTTRRWRSAWSNQNSGQGNHPKPINAQASYLRFARDLL